MTPVFKQMLEWIGTVDANRETCKKILSDGRRNPVIGVSTGGVAEVFETDSNDNDEGEECVVLMNRKGICKLALQTGANMVPCYLFGNSKLLSIYYGGPLRDKARWLSRKVGFALVFFWGRLFLPIPYRVPILGVLSKVRLFCCTPTVCSFFFHLIYPHSSVSSIHWIIPCHLLSHYTPATYVFLYDLSLRLISYTFDPPSLSPLTSR